MIQDAVLGLLAREPSHGYALWQTLRGWSADPDAIQASSVYMALKRLSDAAVIEAVGPAPEHGSGERLRFTFALTDKGRDRYERWLSEPPSSAEDVRLRLALARPADDLTALIAWVVEALADTQARLGELSAARALSPAVADDPWAAASAIAMSRLAFRELSARAQWLAEAHGQLQSLLELSQRASRS
jgi:DNA-binding PadR family transcriptional regulator